MGTKAVLAVVIFCFVQGLNADTLLKRNSFPEDDSPNKESDPVPNNKTEEEAIPQDLLENFNLTILKKGYSEIFIKLQEVKQEYEEKIKQIVAKAAELQEQNSKFLEKLQDDKQNFGEKLKELKIKAQQKLDKLKIEGKQKLQELKDKAQSQQENRTTKRDSTVSLNEGGVISILLGGPTALVSAFKQKVSEIENVAKELLEKFISSFDGNSDILDNLRSMVSDFVKANLSESEVASATFSCFEAQEDAISNLVNLTESEIQAKIAAERQNLESAYGYIKEIGRKVEELVSQTVKNTSACLLSLDCIASLSASVVPQILDISAQVLSEATSLQSFKEIIFPDLTNFIASLERSARSQGLDIAQKTIKCINDKISAADSASTAQ